MSQTLSIQTFLRKYPADLVARYFGSVYGCKSSALAKRSSSRQGKIVAWQGLQPEVRDKVESELGEVIAMSDETGLHAIQTLLSFDTLAPIEKTGMNAKKKPKPLKLGYSGLLSSAKYLATGCRFSICRPYFEPFLEKTQQCPSGWSGYISRSV